MTYASINGELVAQGDAAVPVTDLTFRRAYGAFDFLRVSAGVALFIDDYLERFERSARLLGLEYPGHTVVKGHIEALLNANNTQNAGVQMFLTGGEPSDGYTPTTPNLVMLEVTLSGYPDTMFTRGVKLMTHEYQRDLPAAKSTNYFMAVYLRNKIKAAAAVDALYYKGKNVLETTRCNLFIVKNGQLITARDNVLRGVTRKQLLKVAEGLVPTEERPLTLDELWNADEAFITSSTKGAMPVTLVDGNTIGAGKPGEITGQLMSRFEQHLTDYVKAQRLETA